MSNVDQIFPDIFKTYDIRGHYPDHINENLARHLVHSFVREFSPQQIIIGRDVRNGSQPLAETFIDEILKFGIDVINIGVVSTPRLYYAAAKHNISHGVMITASHAEKEFSGFKFILDGYPPTQKQMENIREYLLSHHDQPHQEPQVLPGTHQNLDISSEYVDELRSFIKERLKPLRVVLDCGNGVNGPIARRIFEDLGLGQTIYLFEEVDPNFPHHENNPKIRENQEPLREAIVENQADLGILWDGDSDRAYFLDQSGEVISPHFVSALIGRYLISNDDRKKMTVEVRTSNVVRDLVEEIGGTVLTIESWHTQIKYAMENDPEIIFGSEVSGHYVFRDFYKIDDGVLTALVFLSAISADKDPLPLTLENLKQQYFIIEEINFSAPGQEKVILDRLSQAYGDAPEQISIDGFTAIYPDWRFNLRESKSEPLLRLNLSAKSEELMQQKLQEIAGFILEHGGTYAQS